MKKTIITSFFAMIMGIASIAQASLIDLNNGVIYDDTTNLYWLQDFSGFNYQNYADQIANIGALSFGNIDNWRMANSTDMESLWLYDAIVISDRFQYNYNQSNQEMFKGRYEPSFISPQGGAEMHYMAYLVHHPSNNTATKFSLTPIFA